MARVVKEDVALGEPILQVYTVDKDNSEYGNLSAPVFTVSDPNFSIDSQGQISALYRLDADQNDSRFFIYKFNVTVSDGIFEDTAIVHLRVDNVNDEYPIFLPTSTYYASVAKDAQANTPVLQLQAIDPDQDRVMYSFEDADGRKSQFTNLFYIDPDTGKSYRQTHSQQYS